MLSNFKPNLEKILDQEKISQENIDAALKEREDIINKERDRCSKEINDYEVQMRNYLRDEIAKVNLSKTEQEAQVKKNDKDIIEIKSEYNSNKNNVMDFLLESVLEVDLSIPEVVKGDFASKFNTK